MHWNNVSEWSIGMMYWNVLQLMTNRKLFRPNNSAERVLACTPTNVQSSTGGVCGQSLTAGKILCTGRQTGSLYLVLWICGGTWAVVPKGCLCRSAPLPQETLQFSFSGSGFCPWYWQNSIGMFPSGAGQSTSLPI